MKILITGASGFIGSFVVEEALRRGLEVWAAVRKTSSRAYLTDPRTHFIELNLASEEQLREALKPHQFDYIVHAAGATKCIHSSDFYRVNTDGTRNLARAAVATQPKLRRFVFISSLSVYGAIREEEPHQPILATDTPRPNTHYGKSKLQAEQILFAMLPQLPLVVLRPTGVFGPREKDYAMMIDSIRGHIDFAAGFRRQDITFIYVRDLVQAIMLALEKDVVGQAFFLSDGKVYTSRDFSDAIHERLGRPFLLRLKAPLWLLRAVTFCGEYIGRWTHKPTALNNDKYHILAQRNWMCDIEPARRQLGFQPEWDIYRGLDETMQ